MTAFQRLCVFAAYEINISKIRLSSRGRVNPPYRCGTIHPSPCASLECAGPADDGTPRPRRGKSSTQQPQNQHSSGYSTSGGLPLSGVGMNTSMRHTSTQRLQPVHSVASKVTGVQGVKGLSTATAFLSILVSSFFIGTHCAGSFLRNPPRCRREARNPWLPFHSESAHFRGAATAYIIQNQVFLKK